jgi:peptide/nickel transport system permease protein
MTVNAVLRRLGGGLAVLWLVTIVTFGLVQLIPGDAAEAAAGEYATQADVEVIRHRMGLDHPVLSQYWTWLTHVLQGNLGTSLQTGEPTTHVLLQAAPATLSLTGLAIVLAIVFGVPAGTLAGLHQGRWLDRVVTVGATAGIALPSFVLLMPLLYLFAQANHLLPATGYAPLGDGVGGWLSHLLLPATALALAVAAELARHTRGCVVDVLARPYIRTAEARGMSTGWLVRHHVLRNSAIPVVTVLGLEIGRLLGGAIVIESVSGISGLGSLAVTAIRQRDYPMLQAFVLFVAVIIVVVNLLVDLAYAWINPKVRAQ